MKTITAQEAGTDEAGFLSPLDNELHLNAFCTSSLRNKINMGRGWEEGLAGLVRQALAIGEHTGLPGWKRYRFKDSPTIFEFDSFAEWISDPNGLGTTFEHLIDLLQISPDEEARALVDKVRQELKLPAGQPCMSNGNNIPITSKEAAAKVREAERGTSAAAVRRRIRNWIQQNPQAPNIQLAKEWLTKLECNPRSRLHQQALREIGIGKPKRVLDVSNVSEPLIERLYNLAKAEEMAVSEVIEDALAVYFRMDDEAAEGWPEQGDVAPSAPAPAPAPAPASSSNGHAKPETVKELPAPGFYGATALAKAVGVSRTAVGSAANKAEDGAEILRRAMANAPIKVVVHKSNGPTRRYEVLPR